MMNYMLISVLSMLIIFILLRKTTSKLLILISVITSVVYIGWRFTTIPFNNIISTALGILLLIAETLGFIQFLIFCLVSSNEPQKTTFDISRTSLPTIDIIIPTYGEPVELLRKTLATVLSLKYEKGKKEIYLCDDGKRKEVKELCDKFNVHYVVRYDNSHSKSGNINNCLKVAKGELMVVFDADMMPKSNFLLKLVPYFFDEKVGFVQAPQTFYNADIFQKAFGKNIPSEQDFFMRDVQPRRSGLNSAIHVGTNAMFRRKCIDEIGGYPTFSITEDIAVGMMIQALGYDMVYVNECLVLGLHPTNLRDFLGQRDRWCRGNLQLLKYKNPLFQKGLNWKQKLVYFDGVFFWYTSLIKLLFVIAPMLSLITGTFFIDAPIESLVIFFIPYYVSQYIVFTTAYSKTRSMLWANIYEMIMCPYLAYSCLKQLFFSNDLVFKVTNKDKNAENKFYLKEIMPHLILITLTLLASILGTLKLLDGTVTPTVFIVNIVWLLYNLLPMVLAIKLGKEREDEVTNEVVILDKDYRVTINDIETKVYSVSYNKLVVYQKPDNILLKNDKVIIESTNANYDMYEGIVTDALKGKATIEVDNDSLQTFCRFASAFIDNLTPYYNIETDIKSDYDLKINSKGDIEWEINE